VLIGIALWVGWSLYYGVGEHYWIFKNRALSTRGRTEAEARRIMGKPPKFVLTPEDIKDGSVNDPWQSMNFRPIPTHPVRKRVLLYDSAWSAAYLFIGEDGRVEHVVTAGT